MTVSMAERLLQVLAILVLWLVFLGNRELAAISAQQLASLGSALPNPTQIWFTIASGLWAWLIPALGTVLLVLGMWRARVHANWLAALLLLVSVLFALLGQWAALLPMLSPCAPIA